MEILLFIVLSSLVYKLLMPFIAWIVPPEKMNQAASYIQKTQREFYEKEIRKLILKWLKKNK